MGDDESTFVSPSRHVQPGDLTTNEILFDVLKNVRTIKRIIVFFFVLWAIGILLLVAVFLVTNLGQSTDSRLDEIGNTVGGVVHR